MQSRSIKSVATKLNLLNLIIWHLVWRFLNIYLELLLKETSIIILLLLIVLILGTWYTFHWSQVRALIFVFPRNSTLISRIIEVSIHIGSMGVHQIDLEFWRLFENGIVFTMNWEIQRWWKSIMRRCHATRESTQAHWSTRISSEMSSLSMSCRVLWEAQINLAWLRRLDVNVEAILRCRHAITKMRNMTSIL